MDEIKAGTLFTCITQFSVFAQSGPDSPWFWCKILPGAQMTFIRGYNASEVEFSVAGIEGFLFQIGQETFKNNATFA